MSLSPSCSLLRSPSTNTLLSASLGMSCPSLCTHPLGFVPLYPLTFGPVLVLRNFFLYVLHCDPEWSWFLNWIRSTVFPSSGPKPSTHSLFHTFNVNIKFLQNKSHIRLIMSNFSVVLLIASSRPNMITLLRLSLSCISSHVPSNLLSMMLSTVRWSMISRFFEILSSFLELSFTLPFISLTFLLNTFVLHLILIWMSALSRMLHHIYYSTSAGSGFVSLVYYTIRHLPIHR